MSLFIPCIIAGGAGTRLWPVSREALPKPFMRLADGDSLLQKTFRRAARLEGASRLLTVTHKDLFFSTLDQYRPVNPGALSLDFLLEPCGRNTAPAMAAAALHVTRLYGPDSVLLMLPADHLIEDDLAFAEAVTRARMLAEQGLLVTFGIQPTHANSGFGYIEQGEALADGAFRVKRFVEKPAVDTAETYLAGGEHLWNAGLFCFRADRLLQELQLHAPELLSAVEACLSESRSSNAAQAQQCELNASLFALVPDISIDYALMEHSSQVAVVPCTFGWRDIGSWQSLGELTPADADGNRIQGEAVLHRVSNCYFHSSKRLIGAVGIDNLIVVDTPDALLIADARHVQDVQLLTRELKQRGHQAYRLHSTVARPWGNYTVLEEGSRFKIKRIVVQPGASLSLQMHHHRSEHWIVVNGMARVTNGERDFMLDTNESTFIPAGHQHRLTNPGVIDLVMIEVQSGEYLGEDDIVRFNDIYGRVPEALVQAS
ncbi:MAG: mannose-1-phosphate guanylyltransferase/mannose-6-phosphate isomerase [Pseudomonadota bacterium]